MLAWAFPQAAGRAMKLRYRGAVEVLELADDDGQPPAIRWPGNSATAIQDRAIDWNGGDAPEARSAAHGDAALLLHRYHDWDTWDGVTPSATHVAATAALEVPSNVIEGISTEAPRLSTRGFRFLAVAGVMAFMAVVMATVLMWQRVEDTHTEVVRRHEIKTVPGLSGLKRRINRLETELAAVFASPSGDPTGRADRIQQELTGLRECVAAFQVAAVSGRGSDIRIC